jgi:hypothetical protein
MKSVNLFLRIAILYGYMYFAGPCIWGIWMVYKLEIITPQELEHTILSPVTIILLASYFLFNLLYMRNTLKKLNTSSASQQENLKENYYFDALKVNCISLGSFGTIGTSILMLMLVTDDFTSMQQVVSFRVVTAVIGSLSGASLVFVFYPVFSIIIFTAMADRIKTIPLNRVNMTLIALMGYNRITYAIGMILFVGTGIVTIIPHLERANKFTSFGQVVIYSVSMALPIFMSTLLYRKSSKKTKMFLQAENSSATLISRSRKGGEAC